MSGIDFMTIARCAGHKDGGVLIGKVYGHLSNEHAKQQAQRINFEQQIVNAAAARAARADDKLLKATGESADISEKNSCKHRWRASIFVTKREYASDLRLKIMSNITIPKEAIPALRLIADLSQTQFDDLLSAIKLTKPTLTASQFATSISKTVKSVEADSIWEVFAACIPLYGVMKTHELSPTELAEDIGLFFKEANLDGFATDKAGVLTSRLKELLVLDKTLAVTAKAMDVMTEHQQTFCDARIMCDIRPVFADTAESAASAMIIHNLHIGFHDSTTGNHKSLCVALDNDDIKTLKAVIERAEKKTAILKSIIEKADVNYLDVTN